jgi:hypothetical protein
MHHVQPISTSTSTGVAPITSDLRSLYNNYNKYQVLLLYAESQEAAAAAAATTLQSL